jgi:sugar phosphate isomerase/epimerase
MDAVAFAIRFGGSMLLGYNTNGLSHHTLVDAIELLAEIGYPSVAITIDHGSLSPRSPTLAAEVAAIKQLLARLDMRSVIETGARFLLDRNVKHEPTLVSPGSEARERRIAFYRHAIDVAAELGSDCVSLWSGVVRDGAPDEAAWRRLTVGLSRVVEYAEQRNMKIGFEPEPGMFIDTMEKFDELRRRVASDSLRLTLDIGHLHCQGQLPEADYIERYASQLVNVHLEDMRPGVHEHLPFGEGTMNFPPILEALEKHYAGGVHVELSRHSHDGPNMARRAYEFLTSLRR